MLQEGIITMGTLSGIFTALLLNSLKNNIIDPFVEKVAPLEKLGDLMDDGKMNGSNKKPETPQQSGSQQSGGQQPGLLNFGNQFGGIGKDKIKWKVFLRDFITWFIIIFILYLIWKKFLNPLKMQNGVNTPAHNTQYLPMGIGKKK